MGKRELAALHSLSSWCLVIVVCLFLVVPWVYLQFVIVLFLDHAHLLFFTEMFCIQISFFFSIDLHLPVKMATFINTSFSV